MYFELLAIFPLLNGFKVIDDRMVSVRQAHASQLMLQKTMAVPAVAILIDHRHPFRMAADAVGLYEFFPMIRNGDVLRGLPRIKNDDIFHAIDRFPDVIRRQIFMRQMAVDTADGAMRTDIEPGFEPGLHDMTGVAKQRGFGFGHQLRRAERKKTTDGTTQDDQQH
jgi:hypothetical protein